MNIHLPTGCPKFAMSYSADEIVDVRDFVPEDGPAVFVIGAMAHGAVSVCHYLAVIRCVCVMCVQIQVCFWCIVGSNAQLLPIYCIVVKKLLCIDLK